MRTFLHVILLTLFIVSMQGCSPTQIPKAPYIETSANVLSNGNIEIIITGESSSAIYLDDNKVGIIDSSGTGLLTLKTAEDRDKHFYLLVLKNTSGNKSHPVAFRVNAVHKHKPTTTVAILKSLKLTAETTTLNKDTNTTVTVIATFSDTTTKDVTQNVTWNITPQESLHITKHTLQTLKDGNITLQATLGAIDSNILHVNVFWEINGYKLPPMPDEKLNNSTLLGIDANNNGVRDDVERYLLNKYKDHHKIVSEIALQSGRAFQIVLADPDNARETIKIWNAAKNCNRYYKKDADYYGDSILINHNIMDYKLKDLQLNTKERIKAYLDYSHNLSGGVYRLDPSSKRKAQCDFNITELIKSQP